MSFRVGQKVTMVNDDPWDCPAEDGETYPVFGVVYTIREIRQMDYGPDLLFAEIRNPILPYEDGTDEVGFDADEFRPLIDTTKQVEAIKSLIAPIFEGKEVELVR